MPIIAVDTLFDDSEAAEWLVFLASIMLLVLPAGTAGHLAVLLLSENQPEGQASIHHLEKMYIGSNATYDAYSVSECSCDDQLGSLELAEGV